MKRLYLMRHAKSSWEEPGVPDMDRPLVSKGIRKTRRIIEYFLDKKITIDRMVSSPAVRAHETAKLVAGGIGYPVNRIATDRKIYDGYYDRILDIIYSTPDEAGSLMLFGHNPTITHLANLFLHPGIDDMPTSCVVCIAFDAARWSDIPASTATREFVIFPKMLQ